MKKNHPSQNPTRHPIDPSVIYAQVNKQGRTQRLPHPGEASHASVNAEESNSRKSSDEVVYADIHIKEGGARPHPKPEETVYAEVNVGGPSSIHRSKEMLGATAASPSKMPQPLTRAQLTNRLQKNATVQNGEEEIRHLCEIVYGNRNAIDTQLEKILKNPDKGIHVSWSLAENPEGPGKIRGKEVLGIKSPARRGAEEGFVDLCSALDHHAFKVKDIAEKMRRPDYVEHKELQRKGAVRHRHPIKERQQAVGEDVQQRKQAHKQAMAM